MNKREGRETSCSRPYWTGIWTRVDSGGVRFRVYFEGVFWEYIFIALTDIFDVGYEEIKHDPLVFWPEQLDEHK